MDPGIANADVNLRSSEKKFETQKRRQKSKRTWSSLRIQVPQTRQEVLNSTMLQQMIKPRSVVSVIRGGNVARSYHTSVGSRAARLGPNAVVCASSLAEDIVTKNKANPCIVYSKTYCPYCSDVKDLMKQLNVDAKIIELDTIADGDDVQAALMEVSGMRTVPQVFVGGELIGGCDDTLAAYRSGTLEKLLKKAGVL